MTKIKKIVLKSRYLEIVYIYIDLFGKNVYDDAPYQTLKYNKVEIYRFVIYVLFSLHIIVGNLTFIETYAAFGWGQDYLGDAFRSLRNLLN